MSESANPSSRPARSASPWFSFLFVVTLTVLTVNGWMLREGLERDRAERTERMFWVVCQAGYPAVMRSEAFLTLVERGNIEWRSAKLDGLDLRGVGLAGVSLEDADFRSSRFDHAVLNGAVLKRARLGHAEFPDVELSGADLSAADLYRSKLIGANLNQALMRSCLCQEADFTGASLLLVDLSEADLLMANCPGADLSGANLTSARLEAANLRGANLSLTRLSGANLTDTDFADSNWWRARGISSADLARLTRDFAPGEGASAELKADFVDWLAGGK